MDRIDRILRHDLFIENLEKNHMAEADRIFCRHDMGHLLDVARIGQIINLQEECGIPMEWIYAAALLHDIGRHRQYAEGIPHERASAEIAEIILPQCGFDRRETEEITTAILNHRNPGEKSEETLSSMPDLSGILYCADKKSRPCFACRAERECNWQEDKKNRKIRY